MWLPPPWLLAGLVLAARCGEAAVALVGSPYVSPQPTETAGGATRSSGGRLAEVSVPPVQGQPMTQRALSVLVLASAVLIVYFVIRTVRTVSAVYMSSAFMIDSRKVEKTCSVLGPYKNIPI
ncbi:hypothetical protein CIB84_011266 [Bambusicola thoracicus]|uniref:Transmembrane protein 157 n=1 Tax=Bambusicola thoracicus TaxID=9083 RepID=A0A2P4SLL5_BAMTH|nr:hypothetical protein CIB84_011266 [Bambusicola thoracicus]